MDFALDRTSLPGASIVTFKFTFKSHFYRLLFRIYNALTVIILISQWFSFFYVHVWYKSEFKNEKPNDKDRTLYRVTPGNGNRMSGFILLSSRKHTRSFSCFYQLPL